MIFNLLLYIIIIKIGYHPKCKNIQITHLCFADDIMVFVDGHKRSIEGVLKIFDEFAAISGLKISLEKSTLYLAGVSEQAQRKYCFAIPCWCWTTSGEVSWFAPSI